MSKSVMISIQPKWCEFIALGMKTIEVRKTKPKLETPFKVYIYCTYGQGLIENNDLCYPNMLLDQKVSKNAIWGNCCNGKVIGEFVCDGIIVDETFGHDALFNACSCMSDAEIASYCTNNKMYGWHISNLVIYDKPRELGEFKTLCTDFYDGKHCDECEYFIDGRGYEYDESDCGCDGLKPLKRPPQSWRYVEGGADE